MERSTYLLAFIVGEFDYVEGKTKEGVEIRVFTPPNKKHLGTFALDVGGMDFFFSNTEKPYRYNVLFISSANFVLFYRLFWHTLSIAQTGYDFHSRFFCWCYGKLVSIYLFLFLSLSFCFPFPSVFQPFYLFTFLH